MLTKGMIMLSIGAIGFILTVIWILADLVNKSKHEEKRIENAVKNSASIPIKTSKPIVEDTFGSNKEIHIPINLDIDLEINNEDNTAMVDNITSMELTEALVEESTEKLIEEDGLENIESIIKINTNQKIEVIPKETVGSEYHDGLDKTESIVKNTINQNVKVILEETVGLNNKEEMTESLIKGESIEVLLGSEKTEGLINEEVTEYLDKEEITEKLDEFTKV